MAPHSERVLITGSSGFTGRTLQSALVKKGYVVSGLTRRRDAQPWEHTVDLTSTEALPALLAEIAPDVVVHLAGIASPAHGAVAEIYNANVTGSAVLLSALRQLARPPRLTLVASSSNVYARGDEGRPQDEAGPLEPINDYAVSKFAVEQMCRLVASSLNIQVVRPFNYTGVGQTNAFLIPKIVEHFARRASEIEVGDLNLDRDISDVEDTVEAYVRLIAGSAGDVLNVCSGRAIRLSSILDILRDISGHDIAVRVNSKFVRANEPKIIVGDRTALDARVGAWPRRELRDTLEAMYRASAG